MPAPRRHDEAHEPHRVTDPTFLESSMAAPAPPRLGGTPGSSRTGSQQHVSSGFPAGAPPPPPGHNMPPPPSGFPLPFPLPPGVPPPPMPPPGMTTGMAPWPSPDQLQLPPGIPPPPSLPPGFAPPPAQPTHAEDSTIAADSPWGMPPPSMFPPPPTATGYPPQGVPPPTGPSMMPQYPPPPPAPHGQAPAMAAAVPNDEDNISMAASQGYPTSAAQRSAPARHHDIPPMPRPGPTATPRQGRPTSPGASRTGRPSSRAAPQQGHRVASSSVTSRDGYSHRSVSEQRHRDATSCSSVASESDYDGGYSSTAVPSSIVEEQHRLKHLSTSNLERRQIKRLVAGAHDAFGAAPTPRTSRTSSRTRTPTMSSAQAAREARFHQAEARRREREELAERRRMDVSRERTSRLQAAPRPRPTSPGTSRTGRSSFNHSGFVAQPQKRTSSAGATRKNLKGDTPRLNDALRNGVMPRRLREAEQNEQYIHHDTTMNTTAPNQRRGGSPYSAGILQNSNATMNDPRAQEYSSGIEDIYKRLRQTYVEFQRNPQLFMNSADMSSASGRAAPMVAAANVSNIPKSSPPKSSFGGAASSGLGAVPSIGSLQTNAAPTESSAETIRLREELARLEQQWEQLSILKESSVIAADRSRAGGDDDNDTHSAAFADSTVGPRSSSTGTTKAEVERRIAAMHTQ